MSKKFLLLTSSLFLSGLAFIFSLSAYIQTKDIPTSQESTTYSSRLLHLVKECVLYNSSFSQKEETLELINNLETHCFSLQKGNDDLRVKFVNLQGCIEHVLACSQALGETVELIGMIHTPMPATPLCTQIDPLDKGLLDESIRYDLDKLLTVRSRAQIVREYLIKGGKLYIVYPQGGLEKRTREQQEVYLAELDRYADNLFDWVLNTVSIDSEMIGATYFFRDEKKNIYAFSIKATQANDPKQIFEWGVWFGPVKNIEIEKRIELLFSYFKKYDGPSKECFHI